MERKFKVGDRVIYEANAHGNTELNGQGGEIVLIDSTACPYTVKFDNAYVFSCEDERVPKQFRDRLWWCKEENLIPEGGVIHTERENQMEKFIWTEEKTERLKELLKAGRKTREICAVFGADAKSVSNKIYELRKKDPSLPGGYKKAEDEKPKLGELEAQMADVITDLKGENDALQGEVKTLRDRVSQLESEQADLIRENTMANQMLAELEDELRDAQAELKKADTEVIVTNGINTERMRHLELIARLAEIAIEGR